MDKRDDLIQHRSMLVLLIGSCRAARTAFEAAHNAVDAELLADLSAMIKRSEAELAKFQQQIQSLK